MAQFEDQLTNAPAWHGFLQIHPVRLKRESVVAFFTDVEPGRVTTRKMIAKVLLSGQRRFGPPSATVLHTLENVIDPDLAERLIVRFSEASVWEDLIGLTFVIGDCSTTYQDMFRKAYATGLKRSIKWQAVERFGAPPDAFADVADAVTDLDRLEQLADYLSTAAGWDDFLRLV